VRSSGAALKIENEGAGEGYVLRKIDDKSVKSAHFAFKYEPQYAEGVKFVFGSSEIRERLVEVPLPLTKKDSLQFKIDLENKSITGDIEQDIDANIRTVKWFGFILNNSVIEISIPEIEIEEAEEDSSEAEAKIDSPLVCLLAKDSEGDIEEQLKEIEKSFSGDWGLIIADIDSKDKTYDIIKLHNSSAKFYHYLQFDSNTSSEDAVYRLKELAKSLGGAYSHVVHKELIEEESKHTIQSFCTVVTGNLKIESAILIKSLREFHEEPVYLICDEESKKFLEIEGFDNLHFKTEMSERSLRETKDKLFSNKFSSVNLYHKPECIFHKMNAMDFALEKNDNTFFLDVDVIVLGSLQESFRKEIVLSPHFYGKDKIENSFKYGLFNAGYIFCADKSFPSYWKDLYLNKSTFFEQEGMNHIIENYDIQIFSESHNFGFWRTEQPNIEIKSFHVHTIEKEFGGERVLQDANHNTKEILFEYLSETGNTSLSKYIKESEGKKWGGTDTNLRAREASPSGKLNLGNQQVFWHHRSGWNYAIQSLVPLDNKNGILFDGFLEKNFSWKHDDNIFDNKIPYEEPWVGFFHNPPNIPEWFFYESSPQEIFNKPAFKASLSNCVGLFTLSEYHAEFLRTLTDKPVSSLIHPTEIPENTWSHKMFLENVNKKIINIGYWLRKLNSISLLPIEKSDGMTKARLMPYNDREPKSTIDQLTEKEKEIFNIEVPQRYANNTVTLERLPDKEYDNLLIENIAFLDLYDSSANNAIIECIARATPILVNKLPATVEYLGKDYPFFFSTLEEAAGKAKDFSLIGETHKYLLGCETRKKLSQEYFLESFRESEIYQSL